MVEARRAADGVQDVGGQSHVQHLFDGDAETDVAGLVVLAVVQGVKGGQVRRYGRVLEFDGPLQMTSQAGKIVDWHNGTPSGVKMRSRCDFRIGVLSTD